jgi:hypothetical protein
VNTRLIRQLRSRIRRLEMQSYFMLAAVALIIGYGFIVSSRSTETTAADLQEVRKSENRVKNLADLETAKFKLIDVAVTLNNTFDNAQKAFNSAITDSLQKLTASLQVTSFLFNTSFDGNVQDLDSRRQRSQEIVVLLPLPDACENVAHLTLQRPLDQYFFLSAVDNIFDYYKHVHQQSYVSISWKPPVDYSTYTPKTKKDLDESFAPIKDEFLKTAGTAAGQQCTAINASPEVKQAAMLVAQIDGLLDKTTTNDKADQQSSEITNSSYVALLAINRFGPLIIIFFFSTLIITLYKYTSRLIGFYYARVYAVEALDSPCSTEELAKTVAIFSPDNVDFGRTPRTPLDIAGDVATKIAEKVDVAKLVEIKK